jgi:hypothetical protein
MSLIWFIFRVSQAQTALEFAFSCTTLFLSGFGRISILESWRPFGHEVRKTTDSCSK